MTAPILWLDIDGVTRVHPAVDEDYAGFSLAYVTDDYGSENQVLYRPAVVDAINAASRSGVEVRWHTMWGSHAPHGFARVLGFDEFAVSVASPPRGGGYPVLGAPALDWWKVAEISRVAAEDPDRPMVWLDDSISAQFHNEFWDDDRPLSWIQPRRSRGLDQADLAALALWGRDPTTTVRIRRGI